MRRLAGATTSFFARPDVGFRFNVPGSIDVHKGSAFGGAGGTTTVTADSYDGTLNTDALSIDYVDLSGQADRATIRSQLADRTGFAAVADTTSNARFNLGIAIPYSALSGFPPMGRTTWRSGSTRAVRPRAHRPAPTASPTAASSQRRAVHLTRTSCRTIRSPTCSASSRVAR
jgi:hypothetical protein